MWSHSEWATFVAVEADNGGTVWFNMNHVSQVDEHPRDPNKCWVATIASGVEEATGIKMSARDFLELAVKENENV